MGNNRQIRRIEHEEREELKILRENHRLLLQLVGGLLLPPATQLIQTQISNGGNTMARFKAGIARKGVRLGTVPGSPSEIGVAAVQADGVTPGALQAGNIPQWQIDDPQAVLTPSTDGMEVEVDIPAGDTQGSAPAGQPGSYNLIVTAVSSSGAAITSGPVNYPINAAPEGPATQLVQTQIS
jgi:hypothetical protein